MSTPSSISNSHQTERLDALYHLSVELSAQRSVDSVLNTALQQCLQLTESQFGFIGLTVKTNEELDVVATVGFEMAPDFYKNNHIIPLRPNIFSFVILNDKPIRTADARVDPRRVGQPQDHPPVNTFLGVPLRMQDKPIGMIGVANRPTEYELEHEQLLTTYAAQVAILIRNAQLYDELKAANESLEKMVAERTAALQAAQKSLAKKASQLQSLFTGTVAVQEEERKRIALEMHDGVNQLLYGALYELSSADRRIGKGALEEASDSIHAVQHILHQVEEEIKRIIYDLRPPTLDTLGLIPTLNKLVFHHSQYTHS
ncbi:MAG: GAF domain-containing protein, partial [Chloroflexota bacterium]